MVINTRFSVGDHVIYRDGMEIYEVKIEKALIYKVTILIGLMKRNADVNKYCFILLDSYELIDCIVLYLGMHCFEGIYPDWNKRMFENKYYFERWYNEFGSHGNILT